MERRRRNNSGGLKRASQRKLPDVDLAPYVGRWVAIVRGRVTGIGESAVEALLASKNQWLKEEPMVIFVHPETSK